MTPLIRKHGEEVSVKVSSPCHFNFGNNSDVNLIRDLVDTRAVLDDLEKGIMYFP